VEREFHTRDGLILDAAGRLRVFHGANVSGRAKAPPFLPLADPAQLDPFPAWGWNLVRLLLQWEAAEPEQGKYDDAYLDQVIDLARACAARGLHTIIDFHQDLYARQYGGDGAPAWALPPVPGGPRYTGRKWFLNYLRCEDLVRAEERFWRNEDGLQDRYHGMLAHVARRFAGVPGVLGYDPINEPMGRPRDLRRRFERDTLALFYRRAIAAVRQGDPGRLVFIEPSPLAGLGFRSRLPPLRESEVVYAPHLYDPIAIATGRFRPALATHGRTARRHAAAARRMGAPLLIGEFGVLNGHAGGRALLESQVSHLDARFLSWAAWHYNPSDVDWNDEDASLVDADGREREFMAPLVRPYAPAVAGRLTWCRYDPRATRFNLRYVPQAGCGEPTEVVIPARCFRAGASIAVEGAGWRRDGVGGERLFIDPDSSAPEVRVTVSG
jgi:endoglycosylceramidase